MHRIIVVSQFLGDRGLSFRGDTDAIGDIHNWNFLCIIELISHYDPALREHVKKVHESKQQENVCRLIISLTIHKMN